MKRCPRCKQKKDWNAFSVDRRKKDGRQSRCKQCQAELRPPSSAKDRTRSLARYYANIEAGRAACRSSYWRTREKRLVGMRNWRSNNPDKMAAAVKAWRLANPDKVKSYQHKRRAAGIGSYTADEWANRKKEYGHRCAYCRRRRKLTVQHVIPLAVGGSNYIENIVPACQPCNSRAGAKVVLPGAQTW